MIKINVGTTDQVLRVILGIVLVAATFLGYIGNWGWIGVLLILTGLIRFCPAYFVAGISSCKLDPENKR